MHRHKQRGRQPATCLDLAAAGSDRRTDVEAKQVRVANLLQEVGCEGLLVLEPENFAWLSAGAASRGVLDAGEMPALYWSADHPTKSGPALFWVDTSSSALNAYAAMGRDPYFKP